MVRQASRSFSTKVAWAAPRESASSPIAPDPAKRSSTVASSVAPGPSRLKAASRTRSAVGRVSSPFGAKIRAPFREPAMIRTFLDPVRQGRMLLAVEAPQGPLRFLADGPPALDVRLVVSQPLELRPRLLQVEHACGEGAPEPHLRLGIAQARDDRRADLGHY